MQTHIKAIISGFLVMSSDNVETREGILTLELPNAQPEGFEETMAILRSIFVNQEKIKIIILHGL